MLLKIYRNLNFFYCHNMNQKGSSNLALHRVQLPSAKTNSNPHSPNILIWWTGIQGSNTLQLTGFYSPRLPTRVPAEPAQPQRAHPAARTPLAKTSSRTHLVPSRPRLQSWEAPLAGAGKHNRPLCSPHPAPLHEKGTTLPSTPGPPGPSRPETAARAIRTA